LSNKKQTHLPPNLTDQEMDELGNFLLSDATSDETMMLDCLDGYLTALVCAPVMLPASVWLPPVWGATEKDEPSFDSYAQVERITGLIMKHFASIIVRMQENPDGCEPIFDSAVYPDSPREYVDGEMWAYGYMTAVNLQRPDWQRFFDAPDSVAMLRPIYLLGTEEVTTDEEALIESPEQREELSKLIPECVAAVYRYWQPYRQAVVLPAGSFQRDNAKIGRNEKCPCGSGRKYKKCCGASLEPESVEA